MATTLTAPRPFKGRTLIKGVFVTLFGLGYLCLFGDLAGKHNELNTKNASLINLYTGNDIYQERRLLATLARDIPCRDVHKFPAPERCQFIRNTEDCGLDNGFIHYTNFVYCSFPPKLLGLGMAIVFFWWLFMFIGLATTADEFFCPSLVIISDVLKLSPNVAGVTFLAFGNGAPDLFSALAAYAKIKAGEAGLQVGGLLGAGMFVSCVVVGVIALIKPFKAMERPIIRDILFYLAAIYWTFTALFRGRLYIYDSIGFIGLYFLYVIVVIMSGFVYKKQKTKLLDSSREVTMTQIVKTEDLEPGITHAKITYRLSVADLKTTMNGHTPTNGVDNPAFSPDIKKRASMQSTVSDIGYDASSPVSMTVNNNVDDRRASIQSRPSSLDVTGLQIVDGFFGDEFDEDLEPPNYFKKFIYAICPIDLDEWPEMAWFSKAYEVFKSPMLFCLRMMIPVVDVDKPQLNWNRYLYSLQTLSGPLIAVFIIRLYDVKINNVFPVWALVLCIFTPLAALVFFTSKNEEPPIYHKAFAFLSFLLSIAAIYTIATEVVNVLEAAGIVFNISEAILGLTLLAWGNSVGDLVSNSLMARQGFPRMGFAACFGGPCFNLLMGIGLPFTIGMLQKGRSYRFLRLQTQQAVMAAFLCTSLISSLILLTINRFKVTRLHGIYLIILYVAFIVVSIMVEMKVIPALDR